jgi:hypothetical protein
MASEQSTGIEMNPMEARVISFRRMIPLFLILIAFAVSPGVALGQSENSSDDQPGAPQQGMAASLPQPEDQSTPPSSPQAQVTCGVIHLGQCLKDLGHDQAGIWTSPLRLRTEDALWLVPFGAATGVAIHYDAQAQQELGIDQTRIDASSAFSDFGLYGSIAGAAGMYFLGSAKHNDHLAETGRLGEEAIVNALLVVEGLKLATNRERPNEGNGQGGFWPHGTRSYETDGSFPSGHAAATFAFARVLASEYPSKRVQLAAYLFAAAVSASRVTAREHFPSDVLVGGTFGYLIGGYVVRHHASGEQVSGFSATPLIQASTRTFGLQFRFNPAQVNLSGVARLIGRPKSTN